VYVGYDPIVVAHARALLEKGSRGVMVVQGDLRDPEKIIGDARDLIDFSQPAAVLLFAILHFLTDDEQPRQVVRSLTEALAPAVPWPSPTSPARESSRTRAWPRRRSTGARRPRPSPARLRASRGSSMGLT